MELRHHEQMRTVVCVRMVSKWPGTTPIKNNKENKKETHREDVATTARFEKIVMIMMKKLMTVVDLTDPVIK